LTRGVTARVGDGVDCGVGVVAGAATGLAVTDGWTARTDIDREWAAAFPTAGEAAQGASTAIRATPRETAEASSRRLPGLWVTSTPYAPKLAKA